MQAIKSSQPFARQSVTMPASHPDPTTTRRSNVATSPDPQVETLFTHPSVRIVAFTAILGPTSRHNSKSTAGLEDEVGTLSWTSPLERLMAVGMDFELLRERTQSRSKANNYFCIGPLSIYRAPGSVAFLSCGKVMHPILPKSQCWCVDDSSSKYVLQIRRPQYWRIEVPINGPDDQQKSEGLKEVLSQILLFEKTSCPFQRTFTVELPEAPITPLKKRPWRPVHTPKSEKDEAYFPEAPSETESIGECYSVVSGDNVDHQSDSDATDDTNVTPRNTFHRPLLPPLLGGDIVNHSEPSRGGRSVTAPPQLTIVTSSASTGTRTMSPLSRSRSIESASSGYSSSVDSFHTVQSWHSPITPLPPSPPASNSASPTTYPYPHDNISLPKRPQHAREISEITITSETPRVWEISRGSSTESVKQVAERPSTPPPKMPPLVNELEDNLDEDHFAIASPLTQQQPIRHRATTGSNSRRRALSPLPPAANIFSPSRRRPRRLQTARHLPTAIIQKTCEILLSPPSHLLHLMLNIAAKIAAGEWRGMVFGFGEGGEKIVGQWDYEDGDMTGESWEEDDYGISLGGKQNSGSSSNAARERVGRSWEVD